MTTPKEPRPGLRERKKERTRVLIRHHTLRLIDEQGYAGTTVDQIAEACDISASTFFRYFRNKDEAATADFLDRRVFELLRTAPAAAGETLLQMVERVVTDVYAQLTDAEWEQERLRIRVIQSTPELRGALMEESMRPLRYAVSVVAERSGRPADDPLVRAYAGAVIGGLAGVVAPSSDGQDYVLPSSREGLIESFVDTCRLVDRIVVAPPELLPPTATAGA